jgi:predicted neutral ceramidase superfamily lipid hydrolase
MNLVIAGENGVFLGTVIGNIEEFDLGSREGVDELADQVRMALREIADRRKAAPKNRRVRNG